MCVTCVMCICAMCVYYVCVMYVYVYVMSAFVIGVFMCVRGYVIYFMYVRSCTRVREHVFVMCA